MTHDRRTQSQQAGRYTLGLAVSLLGLAVSLLGLAGCHGDPLRIRSDGLDPNVLPTKLQPNYALFADRCSKCHSLARALNASIDTNEYWDIYVERMRRQPSSGISIEDTHVILPFLYFYSAARRGPSSERSRPLHVASSSVGPGGAVE